MADPHVIAVPGQGPLPGERQKHRTVRPRKGPQRSDVVESAVTLTREAHCGIAKTEAARLISKIAEASSMPLGRVRATLIPDSTWKRAGKTLGPQASETTARLNHVFAFAQRIWGNEREAAEWLAAPHTELEGATPFSMLRTESGGRVVEALLGAVEYGFPV